MYTLFSGVHHHPGGGMRDFAGAYPTLAAAQAAVAPESDWAHVAVTTSDGLVTVADFTTEDGWDSFATRAPAPATVTDLLARFEYGCARALVEVTDWLLAVSFGTCGSDPTDPVGIVVLLAADSPAHVHALLPTTFASWPVVTRRVPRATAA